VGAVEGSKEAVDNKRGYILGGEGLIFISKKNG